MAVSKETTNTTNVKHNEIKRIEVGVDTTVAEVLQFDEEGHSLYFNDSVAKFKVLSREEQQLLSQANRERYLASYGLYRQNCDERDKPSPTKNLSTFGRQSAPRTKFSWNKKTLNPAYEYLWPSPDRVDQLISEGAEVVTRDNDPKVQCSGATVDKEGTLKIGTPGHTQHVAMRMPKETYRKIYVDKPAEQSQRLNLTYEKSAKVQMEMEGGKAFSSEDEAFKGKFKEVEGK